MKKILVIGATSNVGSYFTFWARDYFALKEYEIIATGRKQTNFFELNNIPYICGDITDLDFVNKLPEKDVHAIVLMAAAAPSYMAKYTPESYLKTNIMGMYNLLEYARKNKIDRFLFMQTTYDIWNHVLRGDIIHPDTTPDYSYTGDHAVYVISKNTAIELLEHYHQEYGLKRFVFRFPTIYNYSPYHYYFPNGIKTLRPVYRMIENAINSQPIEIWGNPQKAKDMVYVADCSQMLCRAIEVDLSEGFYNVGTGVPVTLEEQVKTIIDVFSPTNKPSEIVYCPDKKSGGFCRMDIENAKRELGYKPMYNCKKLFEAYKEEMKLNRFASILMK